jgi:hypothetical protein
LPIAIVLSRQKPFRRVVLWGSSKISETGILVKGPASKINERRLEGGWNDENIFKFDITMEHVALGAVLQTVNYLLQDFLGFILIEALSLWPDQHQ